MLQEELRAEGPPSSSLSSFGRSSLPPATTATPPKQHPTIKTQPMKRTVTPSYPLIAVKSQQSLPQQPLNQRELIAHPTNQVESEDAESNCCCLSSHGDEEKRLDEIQDMILTLQRKTNESLENIFSITRENFLAQAPPQIATACRCNCGCGANCTCNHDSQNFNAAPQEGNLLPQHGETDFLLDDFCLPYSSTPFPLPDQPLPSYTYDASYPTPTATRKRKFNTWDEQPPMQALLNNEQAGWPKRRLVDSSSQTSHSLQQNIQLNFFNQCLTFLNNYNEYLYAICPAHPAAIDKTQVHFIIATPEGADDISPLSIGVNMVLALGAWLMGNKPLSHEFRDRAERQFNTLESYKYLMEDYPMAIDLYLLAFYHVRCDPDLQKSVHYCRRAMEVCESLKAFNSDVYSRCLYALYLHAIIFPSERSESAIESLKYKLQYARQCPYYDPTVQEESRISLLPTSPRNLRICAELVRLACNIVGGIKFYRDCVGMNSTENDRGTLLELFRTVQTADSETSAIMDELARAGDPLPKSIQYVTLVLLTSARMECYRMMGEHDNAVKEALRWLRFSEMILQEPWYLVGAATMYVQMALEFFWDLQRTDCIDHLLVLVRRMALVSPPYKALEREYEAKLQALLVSGVSHANELGQRGNDGQLLLQGGEKEVEQQSQQQQQTQQTQQQQLPSQQTQPQQQMPSSPDGAVDAGELGIISPIPPVGKGISFYLQFVGAFDPEKENRFSFRKRSDWQPGHDEGSEGEEEELLQQSDDAFKETPEEMGFPTIRGVWNEDAHLSLLADCLTYQSNYRKYLWHFSPLHPAVLDDSNPGYFLSTTEGRDEISSLSVAVHLSLSRGSMITGHKNVSVEFLRRALHQLKALLTCPSSMTDYSVATVAAGVVWQASYLSLNTPEINKYLEIALQICKALKAFNSDVYTRSVLALSSFTVDMGELAELQTNLANAREYPYVPVTLTTPDSFTVISNDERLAQSSSSSSIDGEKEESSATQPYVPAAKKMKRNPSSLQQQLPVSIRNLSRVTAVCGQVTTIIAGLTLCKNGVMRNGIEKVLAAIMSLERLIAKYRREQKESCDPWPSSLNKFNRLFMWAARAYCYLLLGDAEESFFAATAFVEAIEKPKFGYMFAGVDSLLAMNLRVLLEAGRHDLMLRQLNAMDKWVPLVPSVGKVKHTYKRKLAEAASTLARTPSASSSSSSPSSFSSPSASSSTLPASSTPTTSTALYPSPFSPYSAASPPYAGASPPSPSAVPYPSPSAAPYHPAYPHPSSASPSMDMSSSSRGSYPHPTSAYTPHSSISSPVPPAPSYASQSAMNGGGQTGYHVSPPSAASYSRYSSSAEPSPPSYPSPTATSSYVSQPSYPSSSSSPPYSHSSPPAASTMPSTAFSTSSSYPSSSSSSSYPHSSSSYHYSPPPAYPDNNSGYTPQYTSSSSQQYPSSASSAYSYSTTSQQMPSPNYPSYPPSTSAYLNSSPSPCHAPMPNGYPPMAGYPPSTASAYITPSSDYGASSAASFSSSASPLPQQQAPAYSPYNNYHY